MAANALSPLVVTQLRPAEQPEWDAFVEQASAGLPMHLAGWQQVMTAAYRYPCHFLLARQGGQIQGVLPLFEVKSLLTGHSLQSMPGAVCAATEAAGGALIAAADDLARHLRADYLLLRDSRQEWPAAGLECVQMHRTVRRALSADVDTQYHSLHRTLRRQIRAGQEVNDVRIQVADVGLADFYSVFSEFTRVVGTPCFHQRFLQEVTRVFHGRYHITLVYLSDKPVAGYINLTLAVKIFGAWGASLPAYREQRVTHLAYWAMIEHGCRAGFAELELGRARYPSGQYDFKAAWGDRTDPIYQLYRVYRGKKPIAVQVGDPDEDTKNLSLFRRTWQRLPPGLARVLGPAVRWHMPFG